MVKKILLVVVMIAVIGILVYGAVNRTLAKTGDEGESQGGYGRGSVEATQGGYGTEHTDEVNIQVQGNGGGRRAGTTTEPYEAGELENLAPADIDGLSAEETAALLYMREEEKLAHDVYVALFDLWGIPTFQNISQSEQIHTDAVKALLERYGLTDPAFGETGIFANPDLQELYTALVARGSQSEADALKVGAAIEEIDIQDLENHLAQTDQADIQQVYENLLKGSGNHLRAFVSVLYARTGETYSPQYLSVEAYQAIVGSSTGNANGRGSGQGEGVGRGGGRGNQP